MRRLVGPLVLLLACGSNSDSDSVSPGPGNGDAKAMQPGNDAGAADAANLPDAKEGSGDEGVAWCAQQCDTPADCVFADGGPLYDADNFACNDGICVVTGCNNTAECVATFQNENIKCATTSSVTIPSCLQTCNKVSDCATDSAAFDADNFDCTNGVCEYTGCNNDGECQQLGPTFGCNTSGALALCSTKCDQAADCAIAGGGDLYGADNFTCAAGFCQWSGCNSTSECAASNFPDSVCTD